MLRSSPGSLSSPMSVHDVLAAARAHGLELTSHHDEFDRSGFDFFVLHGTDAGGVPWVVRTPRRPEVASASRVEAKVLALVAPRLPAAVPSWRVHAEDLIAYPRVEGTPAVTVDPGKSLHWNVIDPKVLPDAFIDSFAAMLAALQRIGVEEARRAGIPVRTIREARIAVGKAMETSRRELAAPDALWRRWQKWLGDDSAWPDHVALVHGDLHPAHLLLDSAGKLIGVLDWTEAQVSDPSIDFAMFFGCFGAEALDMLIRRFEREGGQSWPGLAAHAKERWSVFPAMVAEWGLRTGNDAALGHARAKLAKSMRTL